MPVACGRCGSQRSQTNACLTRQDARVLKLKLPTSLRDQVPLWLYPHRELLAGPVCQETGREARCSPQWGPLNGRLTASTSSERWRLCDDLRSLTRHLCLGGLP
jgi:hypothetical protein